MASRRSLLCGGGSRRWRAGGLPACDGAHLRTQAAPPVILDAAPPRTPPRRSTTWLDRAAAASSGSPTRTRPDALLLEGNARFLERFSPERRAYLDLKLCVAASRRVAFLSTTASGWTYVATPLRETHTDGVKVDV